MRTYFQDGDLSRHLSLSISGTENEADRHSFPALTEVSRLSSLLICRPYKLISGKESNYFTDIRHYTHRFIPVSNTFLHVIISVAISIVGLHRPLSRRLDRCDRVIQDEVGDSIRGNV